MSWEIAKKFKQFHASPFQFEVNGGLFEIEKIRPNPKWKQEKEKEKNKVK